MIIMGICQCDAEGTRQMSLQHFAWIEQLLWVNCLLDAFHLFLLGQYGQNFDK